MGLAGVACCCALIVCSFGMLDSMNFFVKLQFEDLYNFDYKLNIKEGTSSEEYNELYDKYGNNTSQSLGIEIKDKDGKRESNNILVTDAGDYLRFVDNKNRLKEKPTDDGVYVTYKLADTKGYKIGDQIEWHIYGDNKYYKSKIIGFNKDPQNQNVSMTKKYLASLGIEYKPDALYTNNELSKTKEIKNIETIQNINSLKEGMTGMLSMMKTMLVMIIGIAILLGSVIIYNLGILSYTEKQYQFATLKVLGFKYKQIKKIFIKQNIWIGIFAIIIALPLGNYMTDYIFKNAIGDNYDFEAMIKPATFILSGLGTFIVVYVVNQFLARKIKKIDMVSSLKGNE